MVLAWHDDHHDHDHKVMSYFCILYILLQMSYWTSYFSRQPKDDDKDDEHHLDEHHEKKHEKHDSKHEKHEGELSRCHLKHCFNNSSFPSTEMHHKKEEHHKKEVKHSKTVEKHHKKTETKKHHHSSHHKKGHHHDYHLHHEESINRHILDRTVVEALQPNPSTWSHVVVKHLQATRLTSQRLHSNWTKNPLPIVMLIHVFTSLKW